MDNEIIQKHNFEETKNKIQRLSQKAPSSILISRFRESGDIISWNKHNVTGWEVNFHLVEPLQQQLKNVNDSIINLYNLAKEVYNEFDYLDREYITGIITAVKSAETASNQAKTASDKANVSLEKIKKTIEALQATVTFLKDFKNKVTNDLSSLLPLINRVSSIDKKIQILEQNNNRALRSVQNVQTASMTLNRIEHLKDVDQIWKDIQKHKDSLKGIIDQLMPFMKDVNKAEKEIRSEIKSIEDAIFSYKHLEDIDTVWRDVESHKVTLSDLQGHIDSLVDNISDLQKYCMLLQSYPHLSDIDSIWSDVENHKTGLSDLHNRLERFIAEVNEANNRIVSDIEALQQYRTQLESYVHLFDIDAIWSDVENNKTGLSDLQKRLERFITEVNDANNRIVSDIEALQQYRTQLESYAHLTDIDAIWSDVESHKTRLSDLHDCFERFMDRTQSNIDALKFRIDELLKEQQANTIGLNKKIKVAYYIAGGSVVLSIGTIVLQLLGIL